LHKLFLPEPFRYSEDLDFVRTTSGGIGAILDRMKSIGDQLGYSVATQIGKYPKVFWKGTAQTGRRLKIKIEINTYERFPSLSLLDKEYVVRSDWYTKTASVKTFQAEELAATKIRALYQRAKGRDLFDLWLMLTLLGIDSNKVRSAFEIYRPDNYSPKTAIENLQKKLQDENFKVDINNMVSKINSNYDATKAAAVVIDRVLNKL